MSSNQEKYEMVVSSGEENADESSDEEDSLLVRKVERGKDEVERVAARTEIAQRSKMWTTVGSSDEEEEEEPQNKNTITEINETVPTTIRKSNDNDDINSDDDSEESRSNSKKKKKSSKHHKKESKKKDSKKKSHKKSSKSKKKSIKKKKSKKKGGGGGGGGGGGDSSESDSDSDSDSDSYMKEKKGKLCAVNQDEYGKYGIIQLADRYKKQREFEAWVSEVKKAPAVVGGAQWEVLEYFKEFMEDFNTATLPHPKFYNFEQWEQMDYDKKKQKEAKKNKRTRTQFDDDEEVNAQRKMTREQKKQSRLNEVLSLMDKDKVEEMRHQKLLMAEMQNAYKVGDLEKVKKIELRLNPDIEDAAWGKYNAPDLNLQG